MWGHHFFSTTFNLLWTLRLEIVLSWPDFKNYIIIKHCENVEVGLNSAPQDGISELIEHKTSKKSVQGP